MCVICHFKPDIMPPYEKFENAVYNNPHGYGIIIKKGQKLECIKDCPEGGNNPEHIYEILDRNKKHERFVHLRWRTEGNIDLDNTQPFQVYNEKGVELWLMHNGTLHEYSNRTYAYGVQENNSNGDSDTKKFCETKLVPLLKRLVDPDTNKLNIHDPVIVEILNKFWGMGWSRGILISNSQEPFLFNPREWKQIKIKDSSDTFLASNDDYFDILKRGYEYERRRKQREEEARKKAEEQRKNNPSFLPRNKTEISTEEWDRIGRLIGNPYFNSSLKIDKEYLININQDWDMYSEEGYSVLDNLSLLEVEEMVKSSGDDLTYIVFYLTTQLAENGKELLKVKNKLGRAEKIIEAYKKREKNLALKYEEGGFKIIGEDGNPINYTIDKDTKVVRILREGEVRCG